MTVEYKVYTIEAIIDKKQNSDLTEYLNKYVSKYNKVLRYVWRVIASKEYKIRYEKKSYFNTFLQHQFNISKREANNIITDCSGRLNALKELKKLELSNIKNKIKSLNKEIKELKDIVNKEKEKAVNNKLTKQKLVIYKQYKQKLFFKTRKLNKLKQQKINLELSIKNNKYKLGFGTKEFFKKQYNLKANNIQSHYVWYNKYIKKRDKLIEYVGSKDETCGNQMVILKHQKNVNFNIKLRKNNEMVVNEEKYVYGNCNFKYQGEHLKTLLESKDFPLTYRFIVEIMVNGIFKL